MNQAHQNAHTPPSEATIRQVDRLLRRQYGIPNTRPGRDPVGGLLRTILSQNTNSRNSRSAYQALTDRFRNWSAVADAPEHEIADTIRHGGLANQKAERIKQILRQIRSEQDEITLDFLYDLTPERAMTYLKKFTGVGPKTAACVLLFQLGKSVFPVDTHIQRICQRLRWVPQNISPKKVQETLANIIPSELRYTLHVNMIAHGRNICKPSGPDCTECTLINLCPFPQ